MRERLTNIYFHFVSMIFSSIVATIIAITVFELDIDGEMNIKTYLLWIAIGHVVASPFLLFIYFPISYFLRSKNNILYILPLVSTSIVFVNALFFALLFTRGKAEVMLHILFTGTDPVGFLFLIAGFFTGIFHSIILNYQTKKND